MLLAGFTGDTSASNAGFQARECVTVYYFCIYAPWSSMNLPNPLLFQGIFLELLRDISGNLHALG